MLGPCDVCGEEKDVAYCNACHAWMCDSCRANPVARARAMANRGMDRVRSRIFGG